MAARENQGLQLALIIFVMLTIVLSVTTFMFFRKFEEAELKERAAAVQVAAALKSQTIAQEEAIAVKKVLGAGSRDSQKSIEDTAKEVLQTWASNFKETDKHYQQLVKYLHTELVAANSVFVDAQQREEQLKARLTANEKVKLAEIAQFEKNLNKSVNDLTVERKAFKSDRERFKDLLQDLARDIDKSRKRMEAENKKLADEIQTQALRIQKLADEKKELLEQLRVKEQYADTPRGAITGVDQRASSG
jgi:hypothetical protein